MFKLCNTPGGKLGEPKIKEKRKKHVMTRSVTPDFHLKKILMLLTTENKENSSSLKNPQVQVQHEEDIWTAFQQGYSMQPLQRQVQGQWELDKQKEDKS